MSKILTYIPLIVCITSISMLLYFIGQQRKLIRKLFEKATEFQDANESLELKLKRFEGDGNDDR